MPTLPQHTPNTRNNQRLIECSCIIEFFKSVGGKANIYLNHNKQFYIRNVFMKQIAGQLIQDTNFISILM